MVIKTENLIKDFREHFWSKKKRILDGVTFEVEEGSVYGFLGPNGAGKTTTIKILMGLIFPNRGNATILGKDISKVHFKKKVGYLPESPYFYDYLKAHEFVRFYGELFGLDRDTLKKRIDVLLEDVGLLDNKDTQLRKFSKGMLQRIGMAQALVNDPELLILDEPMTGLDPVGRKKVRDIILKCRDQGKTIFFSSHILSDVEMICDKVSIIVGGKIIDSGYMKDLLQPKVKYYELEIDRSDKVKLEGYDISRDNIIERGKNIFLNVADEAELKKINSYLIDKGVHVNSVIPIKETLEDLFVEKIKRNNSEKH